MQYITRLATVLIVALLFMFPALGHDHLKADYVPWGIDEYELFDLTKTQLAKNFKNKILFNKEFTEAYLGNSYGPGSYGPRFLLTYNNGHVDQIQRMFIDGCSCHIMGPILKSKIDALKFSINGLSKLPGGGDKEDRARLLSAQKQLDRFENHFDSSHQ